MTSENEEKLKEDDSDGFFINYKVFFRLEEEPYDTVIFSNFQMWRFENPNGYNLNAPYDPYIMEFVKKVNPKDIKAKIPIGTEKDMIKLQYLDVGFHYKGKRYDLIGAASIIKSDKLPNNKGIWEI